MTSAPLRSEHSAAASYHGVVYLKGRDGRKRSKPWRVKLFHLGNFYCFGTYEDPAKAARVYDWVKVYLWKERGGEEPELNFNGEMPNDLCLADMETLLRKKGLR